MLILIFISHPVLVNQQQTNKFEKSTIIYHITNSLESVHQLIRLSIINVKSKIMNIYLTIYPSKWRNVLFLFHTSIRGFILLFEGSGDETSNWNQHFSQWDTGISYGLYKAYWSECGGVYEPILLQLSSSLTYLYTTLLPPSFLTCSSEIFLNTCTIS